MSYIVHEHLVGTVKLLERLGETSWRPWAQRASELLDGAAVEDALDLAAGEWCRVLAYDVAAAMHVQRVTVPVRLAGVQL